MCVRVDVRVGVRVDVRVDVRRGPGENAEGGGGKHTEASRFQRKKGVDALQAVKRVEHAVELWVQGLEVDGQAEEVVREGVSVPGRGEREASRRADAP